MNLTTAKQTARQKWGEHADAWATPCGSLCFVKADVRPATVADMKVPFGVGKSFGEAFERAER